jgi:hypothetical protein
MCLFSILINKKKKKNKWTAFHLVIFCHSAQSVQSGPTFGINILALAADSKLAPQVTELYFFSMNERCYTCNVHE